MTSKTIKTILFASLIAALVLPFSSMDFAVAEEEKHDDKPHDDKTDRKIVLPGGHIVTEANIISKTVNSEGKATTLSGKELPSKYFIIDGDRAVLNLDVVEAEKEISQVIQASHGSKNGYNMLGIKADSQSFTYFNGYWDVPTSPTSYTTGGTIYTFNALQLGTSTILQPVLQYGDDGVCGDLGDNWEMVPVAVSIINGNTYVSYGDCDSVSESDNIRGTITKQSNNYWKIETYSGGVSDSITPIYYTGKMDNAAVGYETYDLPTNCSAISGDVDFTNLFLSGTTVPNWTDSDPSGNQWCGMDTNIVSQSTVELNNNN